MCVLVCVCHRRDCELVAGEMCSAGIMALCYHAGLSDCERVEVQRRWVLEDRCKVNNYTTSPSAANERIVLLQKCKEMLLVGRENF